MAQHHGHRCRRLRRHPVRIPIVTLVVVIMISNSVGYKVHELEIRVAPSEYVCVCVCVCVSVCVWCVCVCLFLSGYLILQPGTFLQAGMFIGRSGVKFGSICVARPQRGFLVVGRRPVEKMQDQSATQTFQLLRRLPHASGRCPRYPMPPCSPV